MDCCEKYPFCDVSFVEGKCSKTRPSSATATSSTGTSSATATAPVVPDDSESTDMVQPTQVAPVQKTQLPPPTAYTPFVFGANAVFSGDLDLPNFSDSDMANITLEEVSFG